MRQDSVLASQHESEEIRKTLGQIDALLASEKLPTMYAGDTTEMRRRVKEMLASYNSNLENLAEVERADVFGTDPTLANRRFILIKNIETIKVDFEVDIVPALEELTKQVIQQAKQNPLMSVDASTLPPPPTGEPWTVQKVIDYAGQIVDQSTKAVGVVSKAYTLVKALGLIVGIPIL